MFDFVLVFGEEGQFVDKVLFWDGGDVEVVCQNVVEGGGLVVYFVKDMFWFVGYVQGFVSNVVLVYEVDQFLDVFGVVFWVD